MVGELWHSEKMGITHLKIIAFLVPGPVSAPGHLSVTTLTGVLFRHLFTKEITAGDPLPLGTLSNMQEVPAAACYGMSVQLAASRLGPRLAPGLHQVTRHRGPLGQGLMLGRNKKGHPGAVSLSAGLLFVFWCRKEQSRHQERQQQAFFGRLSQVRARAWKSKGRQGTAPAMWASGGGRPCAVQLMCWGQTGSTRRATS